MREKLMALINHAIDFVGKINITMEAGSNAISTIVYPDAVDEGERSIIIYDGNDFYTIDITNIVLIDDEFIANNEYSIITISA